MEWEGEKKRGEDSCALEFAGNLFLLRDET